MPDTQLKKDHLPDKEKTRRHEAPGSIEDEGTAPVWLLLPWLLDLRFRFRLRLLFLEGQAV